MNAVRSKRTSAAYCGLATLALAGAIGLLAGARPAADPAGAASRPNRYIGAKACKNCHSADAAGNQFAVWTQATHSKAWETLASDKALEFAQARGIEDAQKSDDCIRCHVTGHGAQKNEIKRGFVREDGVQCESCHGPGENHMKARFAATASGETADYVAVDEAEIIRAPTRETCLQCHNEESPGYKPFCFHEYMAEIRHINPRKPRTDEERAALEACSCPPDCVCFTDGRCTG